MNVIFLLDNVVMIFFFFVQTKKKYLSHLYSSAVHLLAILNTVRMTETEMYCVYIIIIIKRCWQCKAEREWYTPDQSKDPSPTIPTCRQKEEKNKNSKRLVGIEQLKPIKKHWPCSSNLPVLHHWIWGQQNHSRGTLRGEQKSCGSAARRRLSIPMCHQGIVCNPHCGTYGPGNTSLSVCIGLHLILYSIHRTATDRGWAMSHSNTPPVRNLVPLTALSSSLRCVSAAGHYTAIQYSKTGRTKPQKHLSRSDLSWNTHQDYLKIPSLWEVAVETKQRCFSKVILE